MISEEKNLLDLMQETYGAMTKKQHVLADFIVKNYQVAAFMNTKEIAKAANTSESTLLRLVDTLGFERFADFQDALQELVRTKLSTLEMYRSPENGEKRNVLDYVVSLEVSVLEEMVRNIDEATMDLAVELLHTSKRVFIIGLGADEVFARYLYRFLSIMRKNVTMVAHETDPSIYNLLDDEPFSSAVVIAFHFPRYYRKTLNFCEYFVSHDARLIAVTDNILAPLASHANILLQVPTRYITAIDPAGAAMVLIHALMTGVLLRDPEQYKERMEKFYALTAGFDNVIRNKVKVPFNIKEMSEK